MLRFNFTLLLWLALAACAGASDGSHPDNGAGWIEYVDADDPPAPQVPVSIRFESAIQTYDPVTNESRIDLVGGTGELAELSIVWTGDAPIVASTSAGEAEVNLSRYGGNLIYAADPSTATYGDLQTDIGSGRYAAAPGERSLVYLAGYARRIYQTSPTSNPKTMLITDSRISAVRR